MTAGLSLPFGIALDVVGASGPDLTGTIKKLKVKQKAAGDKLIVKLTVSNIGTEIASGPFFVALYLSDDETLNRDDDLLLESFTIEEIRPGKSKSSKKGKRQFKVQSLDPLTGKYAIVVIDDNGVAPESNEDNNILIQQIDWSSDEFQ